MALPKIDTSCLVDFLVRLLNTPSPTGYTEQAIELVEQELRQYPMLKLWRTRKGALVAKWEVEGSSAPRALTAHVDTLGAMVKEIKSDGRLAVTRFGSLSDFMARTYLRRAGLTPDRDVALIQTGGYPESVAALQAGAVKGAMLSPPYHKIAMRRLGFRELVDLSRTMKYQSNALVTMRRFAQTHASTLTAFMQSYVEAVRVFKQDRDFTLGVLSRAMRTTDREILDDTYSFYRDYFEDIPHPTLDGIQLILEEMAPKFPRAREMRPQDFVDLRFVQALDAAAPDRPAYLVSADGRDVYFHRNSVRNERFEDMEV